MDKKIYEFMSEKSWDSIVEWKSCRWCNEEFPIYEWDLHILEKISPEIDGEKMDIDNPTLCFHCRNRRRMMFRNERRLYKRNCDKTGKPMVSAYPPDSELTVYDRKYWIEDHWDARDYAIDYDENKDFWSQFEQVWITTPKKGLYVSPTNENCDYCNYGIWWKDSYLSPAIIYSQNSLYSYLSFFNSYDVEWFFNQKCEITYECVYCNNSYKLFYGTFCEWCKDSYFMYECVNCDHCIWCVNLSNKKYCVFNEQYTKEEYEEFLGWILWSYETLMHFKSEYEKFLDKHPRRALRNINAENCYGNGISNAKDCLNCYVATDLESSRHSYQIGLNSSYLMDSLYTWWETEFHTQYMHECVWVDGRKSAFCNASDPDESFLLYCVLDNYWSKWSFGCDGIRNHPNSILNKQYSEQEANEIKKKIIKNMKKNGERWEFFSPRYSWFPYNDSMAMDYYPVKTIEYLDGKIQELNSDGIWIVKILEDKFISKAILNLWWEDIEILWRTKDMEITVPDWLTPMSTTDLPDTNNVSEKILDKAMVCNVTDRPFRMVKMELDFYQKYNLPIPRKHYDERFRERLGRIPWIYLSLRKCDDCGKDILSSYNKDTWIDVMCDECFNKLLY